MASPANFRFSKPTFHFQINLHRSSPQKPNEVKFPIIKASSPSNPKPSLLKTTCITLTVTAALIAASSFYLRSKSVTMSAEEESTVEIQSNDVEALLSLTKTKFDSKKYKQAIEILNRMIEIDPDEQQWPVMKARILSYDCESESAIEAFEEILIKDPNRIDAYHYLVMEYYNSKPKLTELEKRIKKAIGRCKKKAKEIRDLKVLIAQIRVIEGNNVEAIRICEEVVKDDPEDFRIYMFQGLMYSFMKKEDEAAKQFEQVARILPENHPYRANATTNSTKKVSEWGLIVDYDDIFCYLSTFAKLVIASSFGKIS